MCSGRNWVRQHRDDATWIEEKVHADILRISLKFEIKFVRLKKIKNHFHSLAGFTQLGQFF